MTGAPKTDLLPEVTAKAGTEDKPGIWKEDGFSVQSKHR